MSLNMIPADLHPNTFIYFSHQNSEREEIVTLTLLIISKLKDRNLYQKL